MSDTVIVALIVAIPPTIAALGAWRESKRTTAKADVIEGHVNSAATRDATIIASQEIQLAILRETIARLESTSILLAQTRTVRAGDVAAKPDGTP